MNKIEKTYFYLVKYKDRDLYKIGITEKKYSSIQDCIINRYKNEIGYRNPDNLEILYHKYFKKRNKAKKFESDIKKSLSKVRIGFSEDFNYSGNRKSLINFISNYDKKIDYKITIEKTFVKGYSYFNKNGTEIIVKGYFRKSNFKKVVDKKLDFLYNLFKVEYGNRNNPVLI